MVFIQPRILRDGIATAYETNEKYNYIRDQQRRSGPRGEVLPLLPGVKKQVLPELPPPPPPATQPQEGEAAVPPGASTAPGGAPPASAPATPAPTPAPGTPVPAPRDGATQATPGTSR